MRAALAGLYFQHRQGLYSLALAVTRRPQLAEDAVQEAFTRLWRSRRTATGDSVAYVYAAVRNAALDLVACTPATTDLPESIFDGKVPDPADGAIDAERQQRLRRAVEALPDEQRQAVVLKVYAGLTFEQIAGICQEPLSTVSSRYRTGAGPTATDLGALRMTPPNGHDPEQKTQRLLQQLPLRAPSAELDRRVLAAALPRPRRVRRALLAASIGLLGFALGYVANALTDAPQPPAATVATRHLPPTPSDQPIVFEPQRIDLVTQQVTPQRSFVVDAGPPVHTYAQDRIERTYWIDAERDITVEFSRPIRQVIFVRDTPH